MSEFNEVQKDVAAIQPTNIEEQQGTTKLNSHNNISSTTTMEEMDPLPSQLSINPDNIPSTTTIDEVDQLQVGDTLARQTLRLSLNDQVRGMPSQFLSIPNNISSTTYTDEIDQHTLARALSMSLNDKETQMPSQFLSNPNVLHL